MFLPVTVKTDYGDFTIAGVWANQFKCDRDKQKGYAFDMVDYLQQHSKDFTGRTAFFGDFNASTVEFLPLEESSAANADRQFVAHTRDFTKNTDTALAVAAANFLYESFETLGFSDGCCEQHNPKNATFAHYNGTQFRVDYCFTNLNRYAKYSFATVDNQTFLQNRHHQGFTLDHAPIVMEIDLSL
jgi:hypothetical protein